MMTRAQDKRGAGGGGVGVARVQSRGYEGVEELGE